MKFRESLIKVLTSLPPSSLIKLVLTLYTKEVNFVSMLKSLCVAGECLGFHKVPGRLGLHLIPIVDK